MDSTPAQYCYINNFLSAWKQIWPRLLRRIDTGLTHSLHVLSHKDANPLSDPRKEEDPGRRDRAHISSRSRTARPTEHFLLQKAGAGKGSRITRTHPVLVWLSWITAEAICSSRAPTWPALPGCCCCCCRPAESRATANRLREQF